MAQFLWYGVFSGVITLGAQTLTRFYRNDKYNIQNPFVYLLLIVVMLLTLTAMPLSDLIYNIILGLVLTAVIINVFTLIDMLYLKANRTTHIVVMAVLITLMYIH